MNIVNTDYIKKGKNVFLFMVDIYPRGLWTLYFQQAKVEEFKTRPKIDYYLESEDKYTFMLSVPRYVDEKYAYMRNGYQFMVSKTALDNNDTPSMKLERKSCFDDVERHYYVCTSFKTALETLKKYHITDKKYNETTIRKRQRIYRQFVTFWLNTHYQTNFVFSTR